MSSKEGGEEWTGEFSKGWIEGMHKKIEDFIYETGREKNVGETKNDKWILKSKQGDIAFQIIHPLGKSFINVELEYLLEDHERDLLAKTVSESGSCYEFNYNLRSAMMFPNLSYSFNNYRTPNGENIFVGFKVSARVFPDEEGRWDKFTWIRYLNSSIQNVINIGILGMQYFGLKLVSSKTLRDQLKALNSSDDKMFG